MARLRASFASFKVLRSSASMACLVAGAAASSALQAGQRLAKPGLSGFQFEFFGADSADSEGKWHTANILRGT